MLTHVQVNSSFLAKQCLIDLQDHLICQKDLIDLIDPADLKDL